MFILFQGKQFFMVFVLVNDNPDTIVYKNNCQFRFYGDFKPI